MTVFARKREEAINNSLHKLYMRSISHIAPPDLMPQDIYGMIVKSKDMLRLQQIENDTKDFALAGLTYARNSITLALPMPNGALAQTLVTMKQPMQGLLPAYATVDGLHGEEPPHPELVNWIERRFMIGERFARASDVFSKLNNRLSTMAQMKMFFNGIVALLDMDEDSKKQANRAREAIMPASFPSLDRTLRDGGIEATQTIAQALLFPVEPPQRGAVVGLAIAKWQLGRRAVPWGREITVW